MLSAANGRGIGPILLTDIYCHGNESRITECSHIYSENYFCSHSEDAGVVCKGETLREFMNQFKICHPL